MIRALASALALALAASPALADPRLVEVMYDESSIVRIDGKVTVQASIMFAEDELIENVAIGDSAAWQVTPNKRANILFVKPLDERASTNMTVVTNKRTYLFDLVASPKAKPLYVLRFEYPPEPEAKEPEIVLALGPSAIEQQAIANPQGVVDPANLNFAWKGSGDRELLPQRTFDDGAATYLSWPAGSAIPAILVTNSEGTEGPVNFTVRDDTIVIPSVPATIVLRLGDEKALLTNAGPERADSSSRGETALASREND